MALRTRNSRIAVHVNKVGSVVVVDDVVGSAFNGEISRASPKCRKNDILMEQKGRRLDQGWSFIRASIKLARMSSTEFDFTFNYSEIQMNTNNSQCEAMPVATSILMAPSLNGVLPKSLIAVHKQSVFDYLRSEATLEEWTEEVIERESLEYIGDDLPIGIWLLLKKIVIE